MAARSEAEEPVYVISVAAKLLEVHPQTLRLYDRLGLVAPARSVNNIRLYSARDVERVRRIQHLTQDMGVNLAGVEVVLDLLDKMGRERRAMERRVNQMRRELEAQAARIRSEVEAQLRSEVAREKQRTAIERVPRARETAARG
jgi:MerR family transcriptional regulator/heat shock protein HspR